MIYFFCCCRCCRCWAVVSWNCSPLSSSASNPLTMMLCGAAGSAARRCICCCVMCVGVCVKKESKRKKSWIGLDWTGIGFAVEYRVLDGWEFFGFRSTRVVDQNRFHSPRSPTLHLVDFFGCRLSIFDLSSPSATAAVEPPSPSLSCSRTRNFSFRAANVRRACLPPSKESYPPTLPRCLDPPFFFPLCHFRPSFIGLRVCALRFIYSERREKIKLPILSRFRKEIRILPSDNPSLSPPPRDFDLRSSGETHTCYAFLLPARKPPIVSGPLAVRKLYPSHPVCCGA